MTDFGDDFLDMYSLQQRYDEIGDDPLDDDDVDFVAVFQEMVFQVYSGFDGQFVHEHSWSEYVESYVSDVGGVSQDDWIYSYIDWDSVEDSIKMDWTPIELSGHTYYYR